MCRRISDVMHDLTNLLGKGPLVINSIERAISDRNKRKICRDILELEKMGKATLDLINEFKEMMEKKEN